MRSRRSSCESPDKCGGLKHRFQGSLVAVLVLLAPVLAQQNDRSAPPSKSEVYVVPFSHLDLYWGGTQEECLSRGNRIITKAIELAKKRADFRFLMEDEVFVNNFVESRRGTPDLEEFKQLVKEGRIEIVDCESMLAPR